nr:hypothetical protein [Tanacetum cinerariifolium]
CVKPQKTQKPRRAKKGRDTEIPQSSGPPKKVGNEAIYIGKDDRVVRVATTATSLEAKQESGVIVVMVSCVKMVATLKSTSVDVRID